MTSSARETAQHASEMVAKTTATTADYCGKGLDERVDGTCQKARLEAVTGAAVKPSETNPPSCRPCPLPNDPTNRTKPLVTLFLTRLFDTTRI